MNSGYVCEFADATSLSLVRIQESVNLNLLNKAEFLSELNFNKTCKEPLICHLNSSRV